MYISESPCCIPETNTTYNYISIKKKRKKKKKFNTVDFITLWSTHLSETVQGEVKGVLLGHKGEKGTLDPAQAG